MEKSIHSREYLIFLKQLKAAREQAGLTQESVAANLGATQTFVSKCERGERRIDFVELRSWCAAMGISLADFLIGYEKALSGGEQNNNV